MADINSLHTHTHSHSQSHTKTAVNPPQRLCLIYYASGWISPTILDRLGKHCLQILYLKDLVEIWHNFFFLLWDKMQAQRGGCADCRTNWPSSQQRLSLALSTSSNSPWPQQQSSKPQRLCGIEPRRGTERSEKQTRVYRCSEITSYLYDVIKQN